MNIEEQMRKEFDDLGAKAIVRTNGGQSPARHDFVHLGEQVAAAMVQAAEEQVKEAQAVLDQTRKDAEELLNKIKTKDQELADMTSRIATLGEKVLDASRQFHAAATEGSVITPG